MDSSVLIQKNVEVSERATVIKAKNQNPNSTPPSCALAFGYKDDSTLAITTHEKPIIQMEMVGMRPIGVRRQRQ